MVFHLIANFKSFKNTIAFIVIVNCWKLPLFPQFPVCVYDINARVSHYSTGNAMCQREGEGERVCKRRSQCVRRVCLPLSLSLTVLLYVHKEEQCPP